MGAVYLARDLQLDRFVAIKVLPSEFAAQSDLRERFLRETRTAAGFYRGVVHRDIKPDNIMLERATGRALVMDFGISRTISTAPVAAAGLTRVGEVVGTPEFMSPEQASGDRVDGRSDLYSLCLVAWYAVTGHLAISRETTQKVLVKQLTKTRLTGSSRKIRMIDSPPPKHSSKRSMPHSYRHQKFRSQSGSYSRVARASSRTRDSSFSWRR